jgi:hypothetical protein
MHTALEPAIVGVGSRSPKAATAAERSGEGSAEPGDELGAPVTQREREWLVVQHPHPGLAQAGGGQLVDHAVADDHPAPRGEGTAAGHQLRHGGADGGPSQPRWEVVDRLVDGVDQPEPIGLESSQDCWLVGQVNLGVVAVQALGDPAVEVVDAKGGA